MAEASFPACFFGLFERQKQHSLALRPLHPPRGVLGPFGPICQKRSGDPNPQYFSKSTAVQMGGVLQYKWEAYCRVSLSSKLRSQESMAIQMGGVLPYKLEVYCRTF